MQKLDEMTDENRQRYLFLTFLYVTEIVEHPNASDLQKSYSSSLLSVLKKFEEDMFFKSVTSLQMLSPDNKKTTMSREKLKELIKSIEN